MCGKKSYEVCNLITATYDDKNGFKTMSYMVDNFHKENRDQFREYRELVFSTELVFRHDNWTLQGDHTPRG